MMQGKKLEEFLILTALDQVYSFHRGLDTYKEISEGELSDEDSIWEPFEYYDGTMMSELIENHISAFRYFLDAVLKG